MFPIVPRAVRALYEPMNSAICFLRRFLGRRTGLSSRAEQGLPYSHRSSIVLQQRTYINCIEPFPEWTAHSLGRRDLWISELEGATASARPSTQCGMVRLNAFHRWRSGRPRLQTGFLWARRNRS